jgi:cytochrome P450
LVQDLRPRIHQIVDSLIEQVREARAMDLIADFAFPLPVYVIVEMLGVPAAHRDLFRQWSVDITRGVEALPGSPVFECSVVAQNAIVDYFRGQIDERRRHPRDDLLTRLIAAEEGRDKLTEPELLDICGLLFVAGHETTVNLIGNGMLALLTHPDELRRLRGDFGFLPTAVEELLRYDSPVQRAGRIATADIEVAGKKIPKGAVVSAILGAANRDPAQFDEPCRLDITRRDNRHLAFGLGARFCLGAALARLEAQIALGVLLRRLPNLELATTRRAWRSSPEARGLKELPVTF